MKTFPEQFLSRFEEFLTAQQLLTPGSRVLLAVSGGIDSMAMMHLYCQLKASWKLTLSVAHVNHQLRGDEASGDEEFVREAAERLGLPFYSARVETLEYAHRYGVGKQEAARELRYRFFEETRKIIGADLVATGHNADDNAETVLMNALRGSGIHGLAGIPLRRATGGIVRPLLFAYRKEIAQYVKESGITFREDSSNNSLEYKRNIIRHKVMPFLQTTLDTNVSHSFNRIATAMRELEGKLTAETESVLQQIVSRDNKKTFVDILLLLKQSPLLQDEIILSLFRRLNVEPLAEKVIHVLDLCSKQTGRSLSLSRSVRVFRDRDRLVFDTSPVLQPFEYPIQIGETYRFPEFEFSSAVEQNTPRTFQRGAMTAFVDAGRLGKELVLRSWRDGDWFIPLGLHGKKKLSDFFVDNKIPLHEKHRIPVLESDGAIVWVCGQRLDERFQLTQETVSVAKLQFLPLSNG